MRVRLLVTVSVLALLAAACTGSTAPASTPDTTDRAIAAETLHDDEAQELTVLVHELDRTPRHPDEHLVKGKVGGDALEVFQALKEAALLDKRLEEFALGLEVVVDGGIGYACLFGDVTDGGASEAAPGKERERRVKNLLTCVRAAPRALAIFGQSLRRDSPPEQPLRQVAP